MSNALNIEGQEDSQEAMGMLERNKMDNRLELAEGEAGEEVSI